MVERITSIGVEDGGAPVKRGRGRPRIHRRPKPIKRPMSGVKEKLIAFRVSDEMYEYLQSEATAKGMSVSSVIRQMVLYYKRY